MNGEIHSIFDNQQPMAPNQAHMHNQGSFGSPSTENLDFVQTYSDGSGDIPSGTIGSGSSGGTSFDDEPPLLEELGINFDHIQKKTLIVLHPQRRVTQDVLEDNDLAGPIVFFLCLGFLLLLRGRVHFGAIYGVGLTGCIALWFLLNQMCDTGMQAERVASVLGYSVLPIVALAAVQAVLAMFWPLSGFLLLVFAAACVYWCTFTATTLFVAIGEMEKQRYLIMYPVALFYVGFLILTIF